MRIGAATLLASALILPNAGTTALSSEALPSSSGDSRGMSLSPRIVSPSTPANQAGSAITKKSKPNVTSRIRKAPGAPLVDSSLLRYISAQKDSQFLDIGEPAWVGCNGSGTSPDAGSSSTNGIVNPYVPNMATTSAASLGGGWDASMSAQDDAGKAAGYTTTSLPNDRIINQQMVTSSVDDTTGQLTATADEWWLGQFNRHNLAQKLVALGADVEAAHTAGEAVQRYCLIRTARRRIRIFLRERDSLWRYPPSQSSGLEMTSSSPSPESSSAAAAAVKSRDTNRRLLSTLSSPPSMPSPSRSPSYGVDDVFEVMQEYGLTGVDICSILTNSPNLALMMPRKAFMQKGEQQAGSGGIAGKAVASEESDTLEETLDRSLNGLLIKTLGLRRYDARKVLRSCPGLLSVRGSKSAVQVMAMMAKLGVSEHSVARDKTSLPVLLSRPPAGIFRLVSFLCSNAVRMPMDQIGPLLRRKDSRDLMDAVIPVPSNVQRIGTETGNREDQIESNDTNAVGGDANYVYGNLIGDNDDPVAEAAFWSKTREERKHAIEQTYRNMTKTALTLKNEIGATDLGKVVSAYPSVLLLDVDHQIMPVAKYLMDDLGILEGDLASVLQLYPMLLGLKIDDMQRVVFYLLSLGVERDELPTIFRAFPYLLTFRIEDMQPVVSYLRSIGVEDVGAFVTRLPPVLGYSVEKDLVPKWEFLKTVCMHAKFELRKFPAYFSYPFERVIKTRYEYLGYRGLTRQLIPVDAVLRFGDIDFAVKVARDDDRGETFRSFTQKRQAAKKQRRQDGNETYKKKKKPINRKSEEEGDAAMPPNGA